MNCLSTLCFVRGWRYNDNYFMSEMTVLANYINSIDKNNKSSVIWYTYKITTNTNMNYSISLSNDSLTAVFTGGTPGAFEFTQSIVAPLLAGGYQCHHQWWWRCNPRKLMSVKETIVRFSHGKITVSDNEVLYDGKPIHGFVVSRILEFAKNNLPYQPLVKFLERVRLNPSARSVEELYRFLEHRKMPYLLPTVLSWHTRVFEQIIPTIIRVLFTARLVIRPLDLSASSRWWRQSWL
jgi:hypothetical protein